MEFTLSMLDVILESVKEKFYYELPVGIGYNLWVVRNDKNYILVLSSPGNEEAKEYLKESSIKILTLINEATQLNWALRIQGDRILFILHSGYVVFDDNEHDIYAYYEIDGCEMDLDSYWSYEGSKVKELTGDLGNWEINPYCFEFEDKLPVEGEVIILL